MLPEYDFLYSKRYMKKGGIYLSQKKVIPIRKRFRPNLAFFLLLLIVVYLIFLGWNYLTKEHISIYEVNTSEISDDPPLYGFILRSEKIYTTDEAGYVNYYYAEGKRIGAGKVVYTIDQSGRLNEMLKKIQSDTKDKESISALREAVASFQNSFSCSDYRQVKNFSSNIESVLFERSRGNLFANLNKQIKAAGYGKEYFRGISKKSGVIVYSVDGYENYTEKDISADLFDRYASVSAQQLQDEKKEAGDTVYKLITSNDWSLVVQPDDECYQELSSMDYVRVTVDKDNMSFNAKVKTFEKDGSHFVSLETSRYMEHYIKDRFLKIELNLKSASGLKIPNSSIIEKEYCVLPAEVITNNQDGKGVVKQITNEEGRTEHVFVSADASLYRDEKYYVNIPEITVGDVLMNSENGKVVTVSEKEKIQGVYCVNKGYCEFRPIEVVYQNKEYTIVSDATKGGLSAYDHIVVDPSHLNDDDFIE